jgi:hypothetical protein
MSHGLISDSKNEAQKFMQSTTLRAIGKWSWRLIYCRKSTQNSTARYDMGAF